MKPFSAYLAIGCTFLFLCDQGFSSPPLYYTHQAFESYHGTYPVPLKLTDNQIYENIIERVSTPLFAKRYDRVSYQVINGMVILRGTLDSQQDRKTLEEAILDLQSVQGVDNRITIVMQQILPGDYGYPGIFYDEEGNPIPLLDKYKGKDTLCL